MLEGGHDTRGLADWPRADVGEAARTNGTPTNPRALAYPSRLAEWPFLKKHIR